ncbi:MAG: FecR domain-containing protein [Spirochaetia bacterium]|nr:FecR domain-containing protein [Spirochaetia bacterium]
MRLIKIAFVLVSALLTGLFAASLGQLTSVKGKVTVQSGSSSAMAKEKQDIQEGDFIVTESGSDATLTLATGSVIKIGPSTRMRISKNTVKNDDGSSFSVGLSAGSISSKVAKLKNSQDSFSIYTPTAVAGVRGTDFSVAAGLDGSSRVQVKEGSVDVSKGGEKANLKSKESASSDLSESPVAKKEGDEDVSAWLAEREKAAKKDPEKTLKEMNKYMEKTSDKAKTTAESTEAKTNQDPGVTNKESYKANKKAALEQNENLNFSKTISEGLLQNAKALAADSKDPKVKEALTGVERISKSMDDANARIEAALARLDARLDAAYKRIEESYNKAGDRINKSMNKDDRMKSMDDKFKDKEKK